MMNLRFSLLACVSVAAMAAACPNKAPDFSIKATDGAVWQASSLAKKPTILVFLKEGCPANPKAVPVLNALQRQYGSKLQIVGVMNADLAKTKAAAKDLQIAFPVIPDTKRELIDGFKASRGLEFTIIATKQEAKWPKLWSGVGKTELTEAVDVIIKHGHKLPLPDLSLAPAKAISGCGL